MSVTHTLLSLYCSALLADHGLDLGLQKTIQQCLVIIALQSYIFQIFPFLLNDVWLKKTDNIHAFVEEKLIWNYFVFVHLIVLC